MRPETQLYLARARDDLSEARLIAGIGLARAAARSSYYAVFHSAEALIFEATGKSVKTHSGVRVEAARLVRNMPAIGIGFPTFLAQAYKYKELADYGISDTVAISVNDISSIIDAAAAWVEQVEAILTG